MSNLEHIETGLIKIADKYRAVIATGSGMNTTVLSLTKRQGVFARNFLATLDLDSACNLAEVERNTALQWFRNKNFAKFIQERIQYAADKNGATLDWYVSWLRGIMVGKQDGISTKIVQVRLQAAHQLGRALGYLKQEGSQGVSIDKYINANINFVPTRTAYDHPQFQPALQSAENPRIEGQVYQPDSGEAVRKDDGDAVPVDTAVREAKLDSLVCGSVEESGQGHCLEAPAFDDPGAIPGD